MTAPKRGRPPTDRGPYNPHPQRQLGRVPDPEWEIVKAAAKRAGVPFTRWAVGALLRAARRQK